MGDVTVGGPQPPCFRTACGVHSWLGLFGR